MLGGGAGHIADMIARMKQNRALSNQRRSKSKETSFRVNKDSEKLTFPDPCPEKVTQFRNRVLKERRLSMILKMFVLIVVFGLFCWFLYKL